MPKGGESCSMRGSVVHQDARDISQRKNTLKNHRTLWMACVGIAGIVE
jgi:hypothetical protein